MDSAPLRIALEDMVSSDSRGPFSVPGAIIAVSGPDGASAIAAHGVDSRGRAIDEDAWFPLSSGSKLATSLVILQLVDSGQVDLDAPLGEFLPDARASQHPGITPRRLLTHSSGLGLEVAHDLSDPPGAVTYGDGLMWPGSQAAAVLAAVPVDEPGVAIRYSNIGYGLLGLIAERQLGEPFASLVETRVFRPLNIAAACGNIPSAVDFIDVADVPSPHAGTNLEPYNSSVWRRNGTPWAGVVTDARGFLRLVRAYLDGGGLIKEATAKMASVDHTGGLPGGFPTPEARIGHAPSRPITWKRCGWGLGVEIQAGRRPHWGPAKLPSSFGQVGSSGCLAWCDPESGVAWVILGARATETGWMLIHGPRVAQAALAAAGVAG